MLDLTNSLWGSGGNRVCKSRSNEFVIRVESYVNKSCIKSIATLMLYNNQPRNLDGITRGQHLLVTHWCQLEVGMWACLSWLDLLKSEGLSSALAWPQLGALLCASLIFF